MHVSDGLLVALDMLQHIETDNRCEALVFEKVGAVLYITPPDGRIFGNPFLFSEQTPTNEEKIKVLLEHTKLFEEKFRGIKSFAVMKKHYKAYVNGFLGAKELRVKLMEAPNADEVEKVVNNFLISYN